MSIVAVDIETSGLLPSVDRVLAVGLYSAGGGNVLLSDSEDELLRELESTVRESDGWTTIVTWNGEEFDLPFLAQRFKSHELTTKLELSERGEVGKYGGQLYHARWGHLEHLDVARIYESVAKRLSIPWSLKPVSRRILGMEPIEVDRRGNSISRMSSEDLAAYVLSDAKMTFLLAERLLGVPTARLP